MSTDVKIDKVRERKEAVHTREPREPKTSIEYASANKSNCVNGGGEVETSGKCQTPSITTTNVLHLLTLTILGVLTWGLFWCAGGGSWEWGEVALKLTAVPTLGWAGSLALQAATGLPPQLVPLLVGVLARNIGYLDMRDYSAIDSTLRKIYPVVILGKASLGWDLDYMRQNWSRVLTLGIVPWTAEVTTVAMCVHYFLGFPWIWGFLLGSIYASVSCAVVMPVVRRKGMENVNWPQLVCTAGGVDTLLSVGVYGLLLTFMFYESTEQYRYAKAFSTLFVGMALGAGWGSLAKFIPHRKDFYISELRILLVLIGGLFCNFITLLIGWGGTGGVAVLACNAMAARQWVQEGWPLNKNPAATAYSVLWTILEPMLFAYTGTYFVIDYETSATLLVGLAILAICVAMRLAVTALVCWEFTLKQRLYVCCTWIPKTIVEAVLCPTALLALSTYATTPETRHAEDIIRLIVEAILITTPIGFLLTNYLGPRLLDIPNRNVNHENG